MSGCPKTPTASADAAIGAVEFIGVSSGLAPEGSQQHSLAIAKAKGVVIAPSGSGKTTLIRCINHRRASRRRIVVDGDGRIPVGHGKPVT